MAGDEGESMPPKPEKHSVALRRRTGPHAPTVYDEVVMLLQERGWCKGLPRRGRRLCLVAAIDEAVGVGNNDRRGSDVAKLARAARVGTHLRDLLNIRNLAAWSDERYRTLVEVVDVLTHAAIAFPDD
jgi:hypothetical protein